MKNIIKWMAMVLAAILLAATPLQVFAATEKSTTEMTVEERINGLELTPRPRPDWSEYIIWYDFSRVEKINKQDLSNYEKLKATYLDVAYNLDATACTTHQEALMSAFIMLGFKVYPVWGMTTTKDGKILAGTHGFPKGWTGHSWVAVEIDGTPNVVSYDPSKYWNPRDVILNNGVEVTGEILYFDSNLHSTYGMSFEQCFAVSPKDATWYQYASVNLLWE